MDQSKKAQHAVASWESLVTRYREKCVDCKSMRRILVFREGMGGIFLGE